MIGRAAALAVAALTAPGPAAAVTCQDITHLGTSFTICEVDAATEDLRLFHADEQGEVIGSFTSIQRREDPRTLSFAMNAGMYHADRAPVGLYVEGGAQTMRLITSDGPGNFGLLPNGVFCIRNGRADVIETARFADTAPVCRDATQSGPMLVIDGALHPRFIPGGTSRFIRNGVGTSADGTRAVFAISNDPVNFHDFGTLFRDRLALPNALYFDGKVSRLHAPQLYRSDGGFAMGPIVGVLDPLTGSAAAD